MYFGKNKRGTTKDKYLQALIKYVMLGVILKIYK